MKLINELVYKQLRQIKKRKSQYNRHKQKKIYNIVISFLFALSLYFFPSRNIKLLTMLYNDSASNCKQLYPISDKKKKKKRKTKEKKIQITLSENQNRKQQNINIFEIFKWRTISNNTTNTKTEININRRESRQSFEERILFLYFNIFIRLQLTIFLKEVSQSNLLSLQIYNYL